MNKFQIGDKLTTKTTFTINIELIVIDINPDTEYYILLRTEPSIADVNTPKSILEHYYTCIGKHLPTILKKL